jgi:hypothetical protein
MKKFNVIICLLFVLSSQAQMLPLKISTNKRFFKTADGKPFFWLGDTGWLLFTKCTREEAIEYLDTRKAQGFNVIQAMVLHELKQAKNVYGDYAVKDVDVSQPIVTEGKNFNNEEAYDYWDNIEFVIDEAAKRGLYMALVPVWGSNVKAGLVNEEQAKTYASFLVERFGKKTNIIWLNGGDIKGSDNEKVWNALGNTLREKDKTHLITFHPRGRTSSSEWFHNADWLDFNMFQSGHKDYVQDTTEPRIGEDNWKFAKHDYALDSIKPTMDGEPSYENIPHGLHDSTAPRWTASDVRRYAYWSLFAGGAGFTYGENSVMQFKKDWSKQISYGPTKSWKETIHAEGAEQMKYVKKLLLSESYFDRVPDQSLVANSGERYNYIAATHGKKYAFIYTYTGRNIDVNMGKLSGKKVKCSWYNPRNGEYIAIGKILNKGVENFDPPGEEKDGNDWILVLEGK